MKSKANSIPPDKSVSDKLNNLLDIEPSKSDKLEAKLELSVEELAIEINYLNNPKNQNKKDFEKRKANLYSYAILQDKPDLMKWLETRFGTLSIQDKDITINIL